MSRATTTGLLLALAFAWVLARPAPAQARCFHFCRGQIDFGLFVGGTLNGSRSSFVLLGDVDYFVWDGLSLGLASRYQMDPSQLAPEAVLRFTPLVRFNISPYVVARVGRLLSLDANTPDATTLSGGLGVAYFVTPFVAITIELLYQHLFQDAHQSGADVLGGIRFFLG